MHDGAAVPIRLLQHAAQLRGIRHIDLPDIPRRPRVPGPGHHAQQRTGQLGRQCLRKVMIAADQQVRSRGWRRHGRRQTLPLHVIERKIFECQAAGACEAQALDQSHAGAVRHADGRFGDDTVRDFAVKSCLHVQRLALPTAVGGRPDRDLRRGDRKIQVLRDGAARLHSRSHRTQLHGGIEQHRMQGETRRFQRHRQRRRSRRMAGSAYDAGQQAKMLPEIHRKLGIPGVQPIAVNRR
jgi:hypothetical protein